MYFAEPSRRQPFVFRREDPSNDAEDCDGSEDHRREVEILNSDREVKG